MPGNPSQRPYRALAAYVSAIAIGFTAVGIGHAATMALSKRSPPPVRRALDLRQLDVARTSDQTRSDRPAPSLKVEPVAISASGNEQWLELRVESEEPVDNGPLGTRYAMSWQVLDRHGNVAIPDAPVVHPLNSDDSQVVERILVPLSLPDGYYRLETIIMAAHDEKQLGWSAAGSAYFRMDVDQVLILDAQDWVWESRALDD
jgi:hypothetical protein